MFVTPPRRWGPVALATLATTQLADPCHAWVVAVLLPLVWCLPARARLTGLGLLAGAWAASAQGAWETLAPPAPGEDLAGAVRAVHLRGDVDWVDVAPDAAPSWRVRARVPRRSPHLTPGARVRLVGRLERPPPADNPGGFDARRYLARDRVRWRLRGVVSLVEPGPRDPVLATRVDVRRRLQRSPVPFGAGVLRGVLLGDRRAVPQAAQRAFEATGTGHLLAVSGLHVGGLAAAVFTVVGFVLRRLQVARPDRWAALAALPAAVGYAALAQWPTSATRAALMVGLYLAGRALGRPADPLNLLAFAAVVAVSSRPGAATEPGFQLSFFAVFALLWGARGGGLRGAARVAVIAAAATAPIQAWHFGTWAPLAPLANLFVAPLAALVLVPVGLLGLALEPVWPQLLVGAAHGATALVALCEAISEVGGGVWIVGRAAAPWLLAPTALVLLWRRSRALACVVTSALLIYPIATRPGPHLDFISVGQGDAILVRDGGRALLMDAGPDRAAHALLGRLQLAGVSALDQLVVTHGHPDHFAGAAAVLDRIPVGEVLYNGRRPSGRDWARLEHVAARRGVPLRVPVDETLRWPRLHLALRGNRAPRTGKENDASLALRVTGPGASVLLTGDLEHAGEAALVAERPAPVAVLKAGHHGSRTSTSRDLLARTRPQVVVASCGRHNRYGFPHRVVRRRVAAAGAELWRTDRDGWIRVHLGERGRIEALRRAPQEVR